MLLFELKGIFKKKWNNYTATARLNVRMWIVNLTFKVFKFEVK